MNAFESKNSSIRKLLGSNRHFVPKFLHIAKALRFKINLYVKINVTWGSGGQKSAKKVDVS